MKQIPLTRGYSAIVDAEDYEWLMQWKWHCTSHGYAMRRKMTQRKSECIYMHREIAKTPKDMQTDHINGNQLDNRKCNLRVCTRTQNAGNTPKRKGLSSIYKGVYWDATRNKWASIVKLKNGKRTLGRYQNEIDAAMAYNKAAKEYFGEFALLNNIGGA